MPLRAVFLDVGRTLLTERPSRHAIYADVATLSGAPIDEVGMRERMRAANQTLPRYIDGAFRYSDRWFRAFIARIFGEDGLGLSQSVVDDVTLELFERFESAESFHVFPGAHELIRALREAGLVVGIVSNWSARLPRLLAALELDHELDFVLASAIEEIEKPDPALFRRALDRAGVAPAEALHAGDHPRLDVEAAKNAGLAAILVDHGLPGGRRDMETGDASERVHSLAALRALILERTP